MASNAPAPNYDQVRIVKKIISYSIIISIALMLLFGSWYTVGAGERAILTTFSKPSDNIQGPGLHFKIPMIQGVVITNIQTQTIAFDNKAGTGDNSEYSSLFAASKDLQDVQIATVVNYHINEQDVLFIYKNYGEPSRYQVNILEPMIRETIKTLSAEYTAEELVTKRAEFQQKVTELLTPRLAGKQAVLDRFSVVNFQFSPEYTKAIELKVSQEQASLTAKNKLAQVEFEAQQRVAQAKGESEAIQLQAATLQAQGGNQYIQLKALEIQAKAIEKWNGAMPLVTGGSIPFLNLPGLGATGNSTI